MANTGIVQLVIDLNDEAKGELDNRNIIQNPYYMFLYTLYCY